MSDAQPIHAAPETWPMTPQEARDLSTAQGNLAAVRAQFDAIGAAFSKRVGAPHGAYRFDLERCMWTSGGPTTEG